MHRGFVEMCALPLHMCLIKNRSGQQDKGKRQDTLTNDEQKGSVSVQNISASKCRDIVYPYQEIAFEFFDVIFDSILEIYFQTSVTIVETAYTLKT